MRSESKSANLVTLIWLNLLLILQSSFGAFAQPANGSQRADDLSNGVVAYEQVNFRGQTRTLSVGEHRLADWKPSSIHVPHGFVVYLYQSVDDAGGYGVSVDLMEPQADLSKFGLAGDVAQVTVFRAEKPEGFVWARGRIRDGEFVPGHWERRRASGRGPDNSVAVASLTPGRGGAVARGVSRAAPPPNAPLRILKTPQPANDDLYNRLRALEYAVPPVPASQTVAMGSWVAGGEFVGTASSCKIVPTPARHKVCTPPTVAINAIGAVLTFSVPNGVTLTANGQGVQSGNGVAEIDVGSAESVEWKLESGAYSYADKVIITRPAVAGMGAFTIAALPVSIIYEPPQNLGLTNYASYTFASERTVVDTITNGKSVVDAPRWAGGDAALMVGQKLAVKIADRFRPDLAVGVEAVMGGVVSALSTQLPETSSEVNNDHTLSVTMSDQEELKTHLHLGPGNGDLIAYYRDARVIWGMDGGRVTLTLLDYAGLYISSMVQLRSDLASLSNGGVAQSGLDADTITSLMALNPMARKARVFEESILSVPRLPENRYATRGTLTINGASYTRTLTHKISESDTTSKLQTTTTVTDSHPGWLTLLGVGQQTAGKTTTKVSLGSSRTTIDTQTKSASYLLEAGANETYTVEIFYDRIFGTFLFRSPQSSFAPARPELTPLERGRP